MSVQSIVAVAFTCRLEQIIVCSTQATTTTEAHSSIQVVDFRILQVHAEFVAGVATKQNLDGKGTCYKTLPLLYCTGNMSWDADPLHLNLTCRHGEAKSGQPQGLHAGCFATGVSDLQ